MERKIIDWKVLQTDNPQMLSVDAKPLIEHGYVPHGEIKCHQKVYHGANEFVTTSFSFTKEFVKYEE